MASEQVAYFGTNIRVNEMDTNCFAIGTDGQWVTIYDTDLTLTNEAFQQKYGGMTVYYPIATSVTYHLTSLQVIKLLPGTEVEADCGDAEISIRGVWEASLDRTNSELVALRSCIAPTEDSETASQAYAAGAYFFRGGNFCKAISPIASGASFTLGTNYQTTTVAAELIALQS